MAERVRDWAGCAWGGSALAGLLRVRVEVATARGDRAAFAVGLTGRGKVRTAVAYQRNVGLVHLLSRSKAR